MLQVARCACLLALVGRLGAFFNPKRRDQIRLYLTAGVSMADVGSDVFSISVDSLAGNNGLASALLATVLLSMSFQILIVVIVHRHHGKRRLMLEILFVVTGVKPFVDTWRILTSESSPARRTSARRWRRSPSELDARLWRSWSRTCLPRSSR